MFKKPLNHEFWVEEKKDQNDILWRAVCTMCGCSCKSTTTGSLCA